MQNRKKSLLIYAAIFVVLIGFALVMSRMIQDTAVTHSYSELIYLFQDQKVSGYTLDLGNGELTVTLAEGEELEGAVENQDGEMMYTQRIYSATKFFDDIDPFVEEYNIDHPEERMEIDYSASADNSWLLTTIPSLLMMGGLIFFFVFMMRQAGAGGKMNQFGKANMKNPIKQGVKTTFADVAGADEEKEELVEIVEFLKNSQKFSDLGARIPKGVLLMGPPGTGKTLIARAVAGEAGVPFFSISGSDFVEMFVGVGASRVRELFDSAKKNAPAIIFIDEIDAVGRHRGAGLGGGHDEREQTLNQLLVEMDGFGANEGIIIIAATNRRDILDPALLRPGRFDRQVVVNYPDVKGREQILKVHARNKPLGFDVDLSVIAKSTAGFTGADLENLLNEAALLAARRNKKAITGAEIAEATIKVVAGPEKRSHKITDDDKKITAYHEAGHAIVSFYSPTQDPVHEISIIPRGMAAGYTMNLPENDRTHRSKKMMKENLAVLLGGRVAEALVLDDICTGASNDMERASKLARSMVTKFGFSKRLGTVVYGEAEGEVFLGRDMGHQRNYSETVAAVIDEEVRRLIDGGYDQAETLLNEHMDQLHIVAKYLLVYEKVDAKTFKALMAGEFSEEQLDRELEELKKERLALEEKAEQEALEEKEKTVARIEEAKTKAEEPQPTENQPVKATAEEENPSTETAETQDDQSE